MTSPQMSEMPSITVKASRDSNGNSRYKATNGSMYVTSKYQPELTREANVLAALHTLVGNGSHYRGAQLSQDTWVFVHLHK